MDQTSFRQLLQSNASPSASTAKSRPSLFTNPKKPAASKTKAKPTSEPAFKPRKVKKPSNYRDRAEERRIGKEGDYAQVEAVLEDFERQNAVSEDKAEVEDKRRYLGGDSDHSILVKGLDYSLLEQNKARLASVTSKQDDELLEAVFAETSSTPAAPSAPMSKKRSRADIIKDLKAKRTGDGSANGDATSTILAEEKPLSAGRFKPIGFKPIGEEKGKKKKAKGEADGIERKKKKRKVEVTKKDDEKRESMPPPPPPVASDAPPSNDGPSAQAAAPPKTDPEPEPPADEDFDIFAGAGDYDGLQLDSDDDADDSDSAPHREPSPPPASIPASRKGWFDDEREPTPPPSAPETSSSKRPASSRSPPPDHDDVPMDEEEDEQPTRLAPLASSALPSIKDFLAMDEAAEKETKRRARKAKKKGKAAGGDESE
ncbi:RED-like protein N-terminal region-domain-containing protein [Amylostereum chailletii]|nr:RED-like protein N-terminal region-domain-containing protein [Amylostereum chailletii]